MVIVKVCGMMSEKDIDAAAGNIQSSDEGLKADMAGFVVFVEKSRRNLPLHMATDLSSYAKQKGLLSVAVTTSRQRNEIEEILDFMRPDILQLHYEPEHDTIRKIIESAAGTKPAICLGVSPEAADELDIQLFIESIEAATAAGVEYIFLDTAHKTTADKTKGGSEASGGTGHTHNWETARRIIEATSAKIILAGGLGPDNVAEALEKTRAAGIDASSLLENESGYGKDPEKVRRFIENAKTAGEELQ